MSLGLLGLLDDVALFAKSTTATLGGVSGAAGQAAAKAAGVVVDDMAVTPQFVEGIAAKRELPVIGRIALGSLRNKLVFILPAALALSQFAPWLLSPILMLGATYLCYEGAEKIWGSLHRHDEAGVQRESERAVVSGAIRTDFVLSAEIMVIALSEVADLSFLPRLAALVAVALVITAGVYGLVAVIVKLDDIGLLLAQGASRLGRELGRALLAAIPKLLSALSVVGMFAMLWVGGHILLIGSDDLGWHTPYTVVRHIEKWARHLPGAEAGAGVSGWVAGTAASAVVGAAIGGLALSVGLLLRRIRRPRPA
ncbi:DUF808 domain-containing protein [Mycobacterium sp.]|uniref:DUF808 domain-containing protein n=1 Tax=Mycobacterium sp. TaxID=1785 RepID=UPI003A87A23A